MKVHSKLTRNIFVLGLMALLGSGIILGFHTINTQFSAQALSAREFKPGRIIDDAVFYNKDAMSAQQIQEFLNILTPNCYPYGQNPVQEFKPPYVCLKDYRENPQTNETSFEKGLGNFAGSKSAAEIIYDAAQEYGINPQVLLVLLKKESLGPLTSDLWPVKNQYRFAMGYGCPDSGPGNTADCSKAPVGFYKQINKAAWQLDYYKKNSNSYRYKIGQNDIQYSPNPVCGTKRVNIENVATLSLYIYTPYTPNDGALANYPGTANCGAYGNRNFYMFFREWFGSTINESWENMIDPRLMKIKQNTLKIYTSDGSLDNNWLNKDQVIKFSTKSRLSDGSVCLRTDIDTRNNINRCVLIDRLADYTPTFKDAPETRTIAVPTCRVSLKNLDALCEDDKANISEQIDISSSTEIMGIEYLIEKSYYEKGITWKGILKDRTRSSESFTNINPVFMTTTNPASKIINIHTNSTDQNISKDSIILFSQKLIVNNDTYYRTNHDVNYRLEKVISEKNLEQTFISLIKPRNFITNRDTNSTSIQDGTVCAKVNKGTVLPILTKSHTSNGIFFRTRAMTNVNSACSIDSSHLSEVL